MYQRYIALAILALPLAAQTPPIPLPNGLTAKTIGVVTSTCTPASTFTLSCTTTGDTRLLSLTIGNMVDSRGFAYGVTPPVDPVESIQLASQQLFVTSSEGISRTISTISTNRTCTANGLQGTATSRQVGVLGYNLAAQALYVRIIDTSLTRLLIAPQNGQAIACAAGGFVFEGVFGIQGPNTVDTTHLQTTILKITGNFGSEEGSDR